MDERPLVSIVTPSFNQGRFLEATIRSVLEQDYPRIEYIVIDGGSTDESLAVLRAYAGRLAYWVSEPDRGQSHAINKGLQRARGEILGWLNSDDLLAPGAVSRAVECLQKEPEVDVVYGRLERIDERGNPVPTPPLPKDSVEFSRRLVLGECVVNQPGSFWRRRAMQQAGGLDERLDERLDEGLQYCMDYEYWIRLALLGRRFRRLDQVVAKFRLSDGSKTVSHSADQAREQLAVLEALVARPELAGLLGLSDGDIQRQARRTRARFCLQVFHGELKNRQPGQALKWLGRALSQDPLVVFERRWLDLGLARLRREARQRSGR